MSTPPDSDPAASPGPWQKPMSPDTPDHERLNDIYSTLDAQERQQGKDADIHEHEPEQDVER